MATTTDLRARIDADLRDVVAEVDFVPELAKGWGDRSEDGRVSYYLEWDELMGRLRALGQAHRDGQMNRDQQTRYRGLIKKLAMARPLLERLDLQAPSLASEA
jgi:hypothetical protein